MTEGEARALVAQYELGRISATREIDSTCHPWWVATEKGEFVARECTLSLDLAEVAFEHRLAEHLAEAGYPVALPVRNRQGRTWTRLDTRLFAIHHYLRGEPGVAGVAAQARTAGAALARFHELASRFPEARERGVPANFRTAERMMSAARTAFGDRPEAIALIEECRDFDDVLPSGLPEALCHGDFHPGNVLVGGGEFAGLLELDCCRWGTRLMDVAHSLITFSMTVDEPPASMAVPVFREACAHEWLAGYAGVRPLTTAETSCLPVALWRHARVGALFHLCDVAEQAGRWVGHEWDYAAREVELIDAFSLRLS